MIITAALIWWNEEPAVLEACVRGAANVADRVLAIDGAYARYPGATIRSPEEQAKTIRAVANGLGMTCEIAVPDRLWKGQCEKRTVLMQRAAEGSDWIAVVDADWVLHANRASVRDELLHSEADSYEAAFANPPNPQSPLSPSLWHSDQLTRSESHVVLYRALPGFQVEGRHYYISAMKGTERVWLQSDAPVGYNDGSGYRQVPHPRLAAEYLIEHRWAWRSDAAKLRERAFENDRWKVVGLTGQEDDRDGLPAPAYDDQEIPV